MNDWKYKAEKDKLIFNAFISKINGINGMDKLTYKSEKALRMFLWLNHGHTGQYGDDGEMQCCQCKIWDYKRSPISALIMQAVKTLEEVNIKKMQNNDNEKLELKIEKLLVKWGITKELGFARKLARAIINEI